MPLFRRRRDPGSPATPPGDAAESAPESADDPATQPDGTRNGRQSDGSSDGPVDDASGTAETAAPAGPVDASTLSDADREGRLDLGSVLLSPDAGADGLEVQLQADQESGEVLAVLVLDGPESAVELRAFAAPKRAGIWDEIRDEIAEGARGAGGQTAEALGSWGIELLVQVPVQLPDGQQAVQASRIAGIDGPRWFLRATFLGRAAVEPETAGRLQAVVEGLAVQRGDGPMAPRDPIPLQVPGQPGEPVAGDGVNQPLEPFERGPEVSEVR